MIQERQPGVPRFEYSEYETKKKDYCVLIPVINEGGRIKHELERAFAADVPSHADIVICDGGHEP